MTFVTGSKGAQFLWHEAEKRRVSHRLQVLEGVSQEELLLLHNKAGVFLQTSLFEGYCLPVFDALGSSTPVVYGAGHALDGLLEGAYSVAVRPSENVSLWVEAIKKAEELSMRSSFDRAIQKRVDTLPSWGNVAERLLEIYKDL